MAKVRGWSWVVPTAIVLATLGVLGALRHRHGEVVAELHRRFEDRAREDGEETRKDLERTFETVYSGLRTMSRLPSVRRYVSGEGPLDEDGRRSIQELYNNLASSVALSEVYLVPADLDPDGDPGTTHTEPLATFDQLIVGRVAPSGDPEAHEVEEVEEVEVFEYRTMRDQLAWFEAHAADPKYLDTLEIPALSGPSVVTCDNHRFDPDHPDDADRSGFVYSVPVHGLDGRVVGAVSGVLLGHALRDQLPGGDRVVLPPLGDVVLGSPAGDDWKASLEPIRHGEPDPSLGFSVVAPLAVHDAAGDWRLWLGSPEDRFERSAEVTAEHAFHHLAGTVVAVVGLGSAGVVVWRQRVGRALQARVEHVLEVARAGADGDLTRRLADRGTDPVGQLAQAVDTLLGAIREVAGRLTEEEGRLRGTVLHLQRAAGAIDEAATRTADALSTMVEAGHQIATAASGVAGELSTIDENLREVATGARQSQQVAAAADAQARSSSGATTELGRTTSGIVETVRLIHLITSKTRLLALNATIESHRAGDAGRSFAVVAEEVKQLATQTALAANEIDDRVAQVCRGASTVSEALVGVAGSLATVHDEQRRISERVADQSEASRRIADSARDTATCANGFHQHLSVASDAARAAQGAAGRVQLAATGLAEVAAGLHQLAGRFTLTRGADAVTRPA